MKTGKKILAMARNIELHKIMKDYIFLFISFFFISPVGQSSRVHSSRSNSGLFNDTLLGAAPASPPVGVGEGGEIKR
jgi:hypothetical protein